MPNPTANQIRIGTPQYYELLRQEADYWERIASGQVDISLAPWRDADLSSAVHGNLHARALDLVVARGKRVLELGCGDGGNGVELARRGCVVDGMDISFGLLDQRTRQIEQRREAEHWTGELRLFVGDLNRLALAPETYDVVVALAVLHHVLDPENLIGELVKTLKPGGTLVCLDHVETRWPALLLRYLLLFFLPTEIPYRRKLVHTFNRFMARLYRRFPRRVPPAAFQLPESSPFEQISGGEVIPLIRQRFVVETFETCLAFADIVAGHLRFKSPERNIAAARRLRQFDDFCVQHLSVPGSTYFLVAHRP